MGAPFETPPEALVGGYPTDGRTTAEPTGCHPTDGRTLRADGVSPNRWPDGPGADAGIGADPITCDGVTATPPLATSTICEGSHRAARRLEDLRGGDGRTAVLGHRPAGHGGLLGARRGRAVSGTARANTGALTSLAAASTAFDISTALS